MTEWLDTSYGMKFRIIEQAHHRNGVSGAPFVVTLIETKDGGRFACTSFYGYNVVDDAVEARDVFIEQTSALDIVMLTTGNIAFAEGNSWRGSDMFGPAIADAWVDRCRSEDYPYDPFDEEWTIAANNLEVQDE